MKIDLNTSSQEAAAASRATPVRTGGQTAGEPKPAVGANADRVELSADVEVMAEALKAAEEAPETRADRVASAREMLEAGTLGKDLQKLADRLIDHLITK
jgi:flagellar biosynthesis anti-sigma factor FlgM